MKLLASMIISLTLYGQNITISHRGSLPPNQGKCRVLHRVGAH